MSILKQKTNLQQSQQTKKTLKSQQNNKTNDYIFKRYKYEQNNIFNDQKGNPQELKQNQQYVNDNQNELEKYKQELENQFNHFDIMSVQENDTDDFQGNIQNETKAERQYQTNQISQNTNEKQNHFLQKIIGKEQQNQFIKNVSNQNKTLSNKNQNQYAQQINRRQYPSEFSQTNPMQLIDFEEDQQILDQQQNISQMKNSTLKKEGLILNCTQGIISKDKQQKITNFQQNSFNQSVFSTDSFSPNISVITSPNQTLDGTNLQQSACLFFKKGKQRFSSNNFDKNKSTNIHQIKQSEDIKFTRYEIKKLTDADNPFQHAVQYSNEQDQLLKGIKIHSTPFNQEIQIQIIDKQLFVSSKIPPGVILKCKLKRSTGFFNIMSPQFDLYLENGLKHMISAKKNSFRNRQLFQLSTKTNNFQTPIRSLMANVLHNTYWLVDQPKIIQRKKISYLDLLIQYKKIDQKSKNQRQMLVLCPPSLKSYHIGLQYDIPSIDFQWFKQNITLKLNNKHLCANRLPKSSQKNFSLIDSDDQDQLQKKVDTKIPNNQKNNNQRGLKNSVNQLQINKYLYLKMQKQSQNIFDIQIQHPLTPLQAMAIILTRFDVQLK